MKALQGFLREILESAIFPLFTVFRTDHRGAQPEGGGGFQGLLQSSRQKMMVAQKRGAVYEEMTKIKVKWKKKKS